MQPIRIRPEYTLLLTYDILPGSQEMCYRYMIGEFVPALQRNNLYMYNAWHVDYGDFPEWQVEFIAERLSHIEKMLHTREWERLEQRLQGYITNYTRRIVPYQGAFQL